MRGKVFPRNTPRTAAGITPAYAGKSSHNVVYNIYSEDHPRLCGEKFTSRTTGSLPPGSPPPMRGKDHAGVDSVDDLGITPAYAGKSFEVPDYLCIRKDHPRLCGEKGTAD